MSCHHGLIIILTETQKPLKAPLKSINVKSTTCGPIAQNTIKFKYKNENSSAISSKFVFPVNSSSAIYHLSANVGGRKIIGKVKEKDAAKKEFDEAVSKGISAVIAKESKESSDILELELGAFGEGEEAEIVIKEVFEMKLVKRGVSFQYKFPTSLFVRYGSDETGDNVTAAVGRTGITDYSLNFELESHGVSEIKPKPWLGSLTKGSLFSFNQNRKVFEKDHDVILELKMKEDYKGFKILENWKDLNVMTNQETDVSLLLSSILVKIDSVPISELPAKEYVFVVDCSGSMGGQRIVDARSTLQQLINSLPVGSKFNIVRFGSRYEQLFRNPVDYNKANKEIAINLAETMNADLGGTQMYECLKSVLECERSIESFKRQIFVLTDGGISNQNQTLELVGKHSGENRVFSFGIGSGCSTALVNGLADIGKGTASFVADKSYGFIWEKEQNLSEICIKSVMASASQHISKIEIKPEEGLKAPRKQVNMIVDSTCFNIFHEVKNLDSENLDLSLIENLGVEPKLCITRANEKEELETVNEVVDVPVMKSPFEANVLHKLAAKKVISQLVVDLKETGYQEKETIKNRIVAISVKEQVLSPHTALIGVADEATVTGVSQRVEVDNMSQSFGGFAHSKSASRGGLQSMCRVSCSAAPPMNLPIEFVYSGPSSQSKGFGGAMSNLFGSLKGSVQKKTSFGAAPPPPNNVKASRSIAPQQAMLSFGAAPSFGSAPPPPNNVQLCFQASRSIAPTEASYSFGAPQVAINKISKCMEESEDEEDDMYLNKKKQRETKTESPSKPISNNYQTITNAQDPSGFWSGISSFDFSPVTGKLIVAKFSDEKVSATMYALIMLLSKFGSQYNEWKLTAIKGVSFLRKTLGENVVDQFNELLSETGVEVDEDLVDELFE